MPNRFEYIQANLKSGSQQKTQAGICKQVETFLSLVNNWTALTAGGVVSAPRVWKDASGTVQLSGGVVVGATPPALTAGGYLVATITPSLRPAKSLFIPAFYFDASAAGIAQFLPTYFAVQGVNTAASAGRIELTIPTGITPANGDFALLTGAWVA